MKRRRFKQSVSFQDRLTAWAGTVLNRAAELQPSAERDALLRKAQRAEVAIRIDRWINSRELQPPQ